MNMEEDSFTPLQSTDELIESSRLAIEHSREARVQQEAKAEMARLKLQRVRAALRTVGLRGYARKRPFFESSR